jgi:hypothetical protein
MRLSQSFGRKARPIMLVALVILVAAGTGPAASAENGSAGEPLRAGEISLMWPIDFATGAVPSSAASNAAAGDQALLLPAKLTLSDSVAVGDFNRDGKADAAQTNVNAGSVSVFLGDGRAGFALRAPPRGRAERLGFGRESGGPLCRTDVLSPAKRTPPFVAVSLPTVTPASIAGQEPRSR